MATVRVEATIHASPQQVWDSIADVGAVHRRLLPGRVVDTRLEDDIRILTLPDGSQIRELIISVDHTLRRMAYGIIDGQKLPLTYHQASFQVLGEGDHCHLVWVTDLLPHALADAVRARVERGIAEMKQVLESAEPDR